MSAEVQAILGHHEGGILPLHEIGERILLVDRAVGWLAPAARRAVIDVCLVRAAIGPRGLVVAQHAICWAEASPAKPKAAKPVSAINRLIALVSLAPAQIASRVRRKQPRHGAANRPRPVARTSALRHCGGVNGIRIWTAGLLVIGDEILSGRTQDRNVAQIGTWLNLQGIRLAEVRMVPDRTDMIAAATNAMRTAYDYLFTTGGIGPTHDDITVDGIAAALGREVVVHPGARAVLERFYADRGGLNAARLRMARVPDGADLIENKASGAPGIRVENIYILAGVPRIAAMMLDALTGMLEGGRPLVSRTLGGWIQESEVAGLLEATERAHEGCQIGSYPFFRDGRPGANFVVRSDDEAALDACAAELTRGLRALGKDVVEGGL